MDIFIKIFAQLLNLSWKVIFPMFLFLTVLLFSEKARYYLPGIDALYAQHSGWMSIIWLYCASCAVYKSTTNIINWFRQTSRAVAQKTELIAQINSLPQTENEIFNLFLSGESEVIWLPINDPAVTSLHNKNILIIASGIGEARWFGERLEPACQYRLNPAVKKILGL
jgi:hypothetical protein